jgi:ABC-type uncharacterized transport system ATPase subunit
VEPLIRLEGISKHFGPVVACDGVHLSLWPGRVKAVLGENGAGKSTLMAILAGQYPPDGGCIWVDGQRVRFRSTADSLAAGIGMVYQHFTLVPAMTVAENMLLGQESGLWLDLRAVHRTVRALAEKTGLAVDPAARVADLSMGERQRVEILKVLARGCRVLILDEPTAVLTPAETETLFVALRRLAEGGTAVVFISHKLSEVLAVAHEVAILRRGRIVDELAVDEVTSPEDLARRMVGREVLLDVSRTPMEPRQTVLRMENVHGGGLRGVSLTVRQGEIVGVVGVAGNGQRPLVETVCGLLRPTQGTVALLGQTWDEFHRKPPWQGGIGYIPEDRLGEAVCRDMAVVDNFLLTTRAGFSRWGWLQRARARRAVEPLLHSFRVHPPRTDLAARQFSGGNLQKIVLAREFYRRPRLVVADQPTQGLDVGATRDVWQALLAARHEAGVLLVTGEVGEALALADRIVVMCRGCKVADFPREDEDQVERIGLYMAGAAAMEGA